MRVRRVAWIALFVVCSSVGVVTARASASAGPGRAAAVQGSISSTDDAATTTSGVANNDETFFKRIYGHPTTKKIVTALLVLGLGRRVDFRDVLQSGHLVEIAGAIFHPVRLVRSTFIGLVAAEVWDRVGPLRRLGFFRRKRKGRKEKKVTSYRRVKKSLPKKVQTKGIIEEPQDLEAQPQSQRRRQTFTSKEETFDNLISESQESMNLLSGSDKERLLSNYKVGGGQKQQWHRQWWRWVKKGRNKATRGKKKRSSPRIMAKRKFAMGWIVGHLLSPLLWLTPIGGWIAVCCVVVELVNWLDDKADSSALDTKEMLEFVEPLRSDTIKTILIGSMVGAAISEY